MEIARTPSRTDVHALIALRDAVAHRLSCSHAALFAIPSDHADGTSWHAEGSRLVPAAALTPESLHALQAHAGSILADIRRVAASEIGPIRAALPRLRAAGPECTLWALDGRPILAGWGSPGNAPQWVILTDDERSAWTDTVLPHPPSLFISACLGTALGLLAAASLAWIYSDLLQCRAQTPERTGNSMMTGAAHHASTSAGIDSGMSMRSGSVSVFGSKRDGNRVDIGANTRSTAWNAHDPAAMAGCWQRITNLASSDNDVINHNDYLAWKMCLAPDGQNGTLDVQLAKAGGCTANAQAGFEGDRLVIHTGACHVNNATYLPRVTSCQRLDDDRVSCSIHVVANPAILPPGYRQGHEDVLQKMADVTNPTEDKR